MLLDPSRWTQSIDGFFMTEMAFKKQSMKQTKMQQKTMGEATGEVGGCLNCLLLWGWGYYLYDVKLFVRNKQTDRVCVDSSICPAHCGQSSFLSKLTKLQIKKEK